MRTETGLSLVASTPLLKKAHLTAVSPSGAQTLTATAESKDDDKPVLLLQGLQGWVPVLSWEPVLLLLQVR